MSARGLRWLFACGLSLAMSTGVAGAQTIAPMPTKWQSTLGREHPLVGRAFDTSGSTVPVEAAALAAKLAEAPIILLGEIHDNADHHILQAWALAQIKSIRASTPGALPVPAVVFEQLRDDQQSAIDAFANLKATSLDKATVAEFKRLVGWAKSGWPVDAYDPLFQEVLTADAPPYPALYAGDVTRAAIMKTAKEGPDSLSADDKKRFSLDVSLDPKLDAASLEEIEQAHCGAMPKSAFGGMAFAQRYRDAHLADTLLTAVGRNRSAALIAGDGHVRSDRGVPWYIRKRSPGTKVVSLIFAEVEDGKTDPAAYVPRDPDGKPAADYIVFTPKAERPDPCEKMRAK